MDYLFPLLDRKAAAEGTMAFTLDTTGSDYSFKAGQNADFTLIDPPQTDSEGNTRTFSLVSSPTVKDRIMFATRMRDTAFKNSLKEIPIGTQIKVSQAMGQFTLPKDQTKSVVFLAGGIGITPFMSILQAAADQQLQHQIILFFSNRTPALAPFMSDLQELVGKIPHYQFIPTLTDEMPTDWKGEQGRITAELLQKYITDFSTPIFYTAGPASMTEVMLSLLEEFNVPEEHIKVEDFPGY